MKKIILSLAAVLLTGAMALLTAGCGEEDKTVADPNASFPTVAKSGSAADTSPTKYTLSTTAPPTTVPTTVAPTTKPQPTTVAATKATSKATSKASSAVSSKAQSSESSKAETQPTKAHGSFTDADANFIYNEATVVLNGDFSEVSGKLGEAKGIEAKPSEQGEGEDKKYTYEGFEVNTYPDGTVEKVYKVQVLSADIVTAKGVRIGSTFDDVIAAYGDDFEVDGGYIVFETDDGKILSFDINGDVVKGIDYSYDFYA